MRKFHELVFDDAIDGTGAVYTPPRWNGLLAETNQLEVAAVISQVSGTSPTLTIASEISPDDRLFTAKYDVAELNGVALPTNAVVVGTFRDLGTRPTSGYRRLRLQLGGTTPRAYLRVYATGRCDETAPAPEDRVYSASSDVSTPAVNTAAVVSYAADAAGGRHVVTGVAWSYSGAPTNGNLLIQSGGTTRLSLDITGAGPGSVLYPTPTAGDAGAALTVTLSAGGAGVAGKLTVLGHFVDGPFVTGSP